METQEPFTGGSGEILDDSFTMAGIAKDKLFITNVVHCHPPEDHPKSLPKWKANCTPYLHRELQIVQPRLVVGLGDDAELAVRSAYPPGVEPLTWPFTVSATRSQATSTPALLFAPHPRRMHWQPQHKEQYVTSLADALKWAFDI
jgi:DNA polymerase